MPMIGRCGIRGGHQRPRRGTSRLERLGEQHAIDHVRNGIPVPELKVSEAPTTARRACPRRTVEPGALRWLGRPSRSSSRRPPRRVRDMDSASSSPKRVATAILCINSRLSSSDSCSGGAGTRPGWPARCSRQRHPHPAWPAPVDERADQEVKKPRLSFTTIGVLPMASVINTRQRLIKVFLP